MKWLGILLALACAVPSVQAKELRFYLACEKGEKPRLPPKGVSYRAIKISKPSAKEGKWETSYALEVKREAKPGVEVFNFVSAGSGDEDYNEYNIDDSEKERIAINVESAYIQNKFSWVGLIDREGYQFIRCDKEL